jgi:hypothetical protein
MRHRMLAAGTACCWPMGLHTREIWVPCSDHLLLAAAPHAGSWVHALRAPAYACRYTSSNSSEVSSADIILAASPRQPKVHPIKIHVGVDVPGFDDVGTPEQSAVLRAVESSAVHYWQDA